MFKILTAVLRVVLAVTLFRVLWEYLCPYTVDGKIIFPTDKSLRWKVSVIVLASFLTLLYIVSWSFIVVIRAIRWVANILNRIFFRK